MIRLIAAIDRRRGMGKHNIQPWYVPADERYFTENTHKFGGNILVGGNTFRGSMLGRPLSGRTNYLVTHDKTPVAGVTLVHDIKKFLDEFQQDLWVIGGAQVFEQAMTLGYADELYLTHIDADFGCDRFFPAFDDFEQVTHSEPFEENGFHFYYSVYRRKD